MALTSHEARHRIARRIAEEFMKDHSISVINLGVGIPTLVANYIDRDRLFIQTENGMLGVGPEAPKDLVDLELINAGRVPVLETQGCCYFDSALSFGMIRGGHVDATAIGALEVDGHGNIANWIVPGSKQLGVGGAMDLVTGVKKVVIAMTHTKKDGSPKIVENCSLPITGFQEVDLVVTELAVFAFVSGRLVLRELQPDVSLEMVRASTGASFEDCRDVLDPF